MGRKSALQKPLDKLILKVHHVELAKCANFKEFKQAIRVMMWNMEATLKSLSRYEPDDARVRRAANNVKAAALRLIQMCRAVPETFEDPERWREAAIQIAANYEQFRIEAGHLYQAAVPGSRFPILRSAL
jgi:hypothetical protein